MTVKRITFLQELLAFMGLEDRLHLEWISSAEAQKFVRVITDFTEKIKSLGPNPLVGMNSAAALWKPGASPLDLETMLQNDEPLQPDIAADDKEEEAAHATANKKVA